MTGMGTPHLTGRGLRTSEFGGCPRPPWRETPCCLRTTLGPREMPRVRARASDAEQEEVAPRDPRLKSVMSIEYDQEALPPTRRRVRAGMIENERLLTVPVG